MHSPSRDPQNNLNFLRLFAAFLVLYGHSYIFLGLKEPLFLSWLPLGPLGVYIFFSISGYLVAQSWNNDPDLFRFFLRRVLRIFPGLIFCVVFVAFVLGAVVTTLPIYDYISHPDTRGYLNTIFLYIHHYLPGVFKTNAYPGAVNGSLWSLPIEFFMYILLVFFAFFKPNKWFFLGLAILSALFTQFFAWQTDQMYIFYAQDMRQVLICGSYFWIGAVIYFFELKKYFTLTVAVLAISSLICLSISPLLSRFFAMVLIPVAALSFGLSYSSWLNKITKHGDYSYGIYIYAFPIQQTIVHYYPQIGLGFYLLSCTIFTLLFGALSWHLIEKPSLNFKPRRHLI
jgi:peptidoglycan/LPS O-acetylase OafA/YrhL